jgi:hypothetical protein
MEGREEMITLRDTVEIETPPQKIFEWFAHLDENFRTWHPKDHVECRYLKGSPLEQDSVLYFEVYLLGKLQKAKFHITNVVPNSKIEYRLGFPLSLLGGGGAFIMEPRGADSVFIQDVYLGRKTPLLGTMLDVFIKIFLGRLNEDYKRHIAEEGQNLKRIMEGGT